MDDSPNGSGSPDRPNLDSIPCPFLAAAYNEGDLEPEADGTLTTDAMTQAMLDVGLVKPVVWQLVRGADKTDDVQGQFNLFDLKDTALDHSGSTGIRDPEVDPERLAALLSHGENGRLYGKHFAAAVAHFRQDDPGFVGSVKEMNELTALIEVFGRLDDDGERYLSNDDVQRLWVECRYPEDWTPRPAGDIGIIDLMQTSGKMGAQRAWDRLSGLVKKIID